MTGDAFPRAPAAEAADHLRAFWDARYGAPDYVYGTAPNDFLVRHLPALRPGARVLCLADGEGRNGVWLARQGCAVTSVDIAPAGGAKAQALARRHGVALITRTADVTRMDDWSPGPQAAGSRAAAQGDGDGGWDAIVSIFLHLPAGPRRRLHRRAAQALRPGGVFLWEAYAPEQFGQPTGGPQAAALLPPLADVVEDFAGTGCAVLHQWTGWRDVREGALHSGPGAVTQLVVQRPG